MRVLSCFTDDRSSFKLSFRILEGNFYLKPFLSIALLYFFVLSWTLASEDALLGSDGLEGVTGKVVILGA